MPALPHITAFRASPDGGRGLSRDIRVRWAMYELDQPFAVDLKSFAELKEPAHLALHPFGQIPTYQDQDVALFESGAIVLYLAERHPGLLPDGVPARFQAISWLFAALNTVEPTIFEYGLARVLERQKVWFAERQEMLATRIRRTLSFLAERLGDADWLDDRFTCGDLMLVTVLRRLHGSGLLEEFPTLAAYVARGEARPACQRALADLAAEAAAAKGN